MHDPTHLPGLEQRIALRSFDRVSVAATLVLATVALLLGGVWIALPAFAALCLAADRLVPLPTTGEADRAFSRLQRRRRWTRCRLDVLEDVHPWVRTARRRDLGVHCIPVGSLAGTVEPAKARVFDADWRPSRAARDRWTRLWLGRQSGSPIPPVSVFRVDGAHWVRDGHHRASVARHRDAPTIDAAVVELLPQAEVPS